jgi:hypothetical protein
VPGITDLNELLAGLRPELRDGEFVVLTLSAERAASVPAEASVVEAEGVTVVIARAEADRLGLPYDFVARWLTLRVHSSLEAVGLTAAFATALANAGISANVLAGFFHDHLLVATADAERAVAVLEALAAAH